MNIAKLSQKFLSNLRVETWFAEETTSTNTIAKEDAASVHAPLKVYIASHQTAGRGRNQNTWSDDGHALLSSWSFSFEKNPQPILAPLVGLTVYQNLTRRFLGIPFSLKAPNDILIGKEKLCGILIENVLTGTQGRSIVGIGMNVTDSPPNLGATHLMNHTEVNEKIWQNFLQGLATDLALCMKAAESAELKPEACRDLLGALRKNPLLTDELNEVSPSGSLHFKNQTIDWKTL